MPDYGAEGGIVPLYLAGIYRRRVNLEGAYGAWRGKTNEIIVIHDTRTRVGIMLVPNNTGT